MLYTVDIADMKTATTSNMTLVTYSLGSCVGLTLYDQTTGIGGMIHCMLPISKMHKKKAAICPGMFVDTGVPLLLKKLFALGSKRKNLIAKVAGGASILDRNGLFNVGKRNYMVLRKLLWKNDILLNSEDIGGSKPRTMYLVMSDGSTIINSCGQETRL